MFFNLWKAIAEEGPSAIEKNKMHIAALEWAEIEEVYPNLVDADFSGCNVYEEESLILENPFKRQLNSDTGLPDYYFRVCVPRVEFELHGMINYRTLIDSMGQSDYEGYLLTCGCSEPGCAGFWSEYCHVSNKMIHWSINKYDVFVELFFERERYEKNALSMFQDLLAHETGWDNLACPSYENFAAFHDHVMWLLDQRPYYRDMWQECKERQGEPIT